MTELVFLLEERSMQEVLEVMAPVLVPDGIICRFIPHEGKRDLQKSIPRKLKAWRTPGVQFVVVHDKDGGECRTVKNMLTTLCTEGGRPDTLVRIVCHHLESWFLGDLAAVEQAYGINGISIRQTERRFSHPDSLANAEQELRRLVPTYQKIGGSRLIAPHLAPDNNTSQSFRAFIAGVRRIVQTGSGQA